MGLDTFDKCLISGIVGAIAAAAILGVSFSRGIEVLRYKESEVKLVECQKDLPRSQTCELIAKPRG